MRVELTAVADVPRLTSVLVTEVPMLAPMTIGMAVSIGMVPPPTSATTREVVVDEDCTRVVARTPTKRPTSGSDALSIRLPTTPPENILKALPSMPMLTRKA